jgi:hypothetical protein
MRSFDAMSVQPVPHFTVSKVVYISATIAAAVVLLGVVIAAVIYLRRRRDATPLMFLLGGALTVGYEPLVDVLGKCYLPDQYQWTIFTVLGRDMPAYAVLVYSAFFGGFAWMSWSHLRSGKPASGLWRKYAIAICINTFLFETPAVTIFHLYKYYGHQPLDFWGFPLWWPFVNTAGPIAAGVVVYLLGEYSGLSKRTLLGLCVVLVPMTNGAANGAAAYPTWVALNSDVQPWVTWCAGAITVALAVLIVRGAIGLVDALKSRVAVSPRPVSDLASTGRSVAANS